MKMVFNSYFQLERSQTTDYRLLLLVAVVFVLAMVGLVVEVVILAVKAHIKIMIMQVNALVLVKYNAFWDFELYLISTICR